MSYEKLIDKYPRIKLLMQMPSFQKLTKEKQEYVLGCLEDALFWFEMENEEKQGNEGNGFHFLAAALGLQRAEAEADAKDLQGAERETFLKSHQELYSTYNPQFGTDAETQSQKKKP